MEPQALIQRGQMGYSKQQKQLRDASTAPVAPVVSAPVKQYNAGGGVVNPYNQPVTSASMAPAAPLNLPPATVPVAPANAEAAIAGSTANAVRTSEQQAAAQQQAQPTQSDNLARTMQSVLGIQDQIATETASVDRAAQDQARMDADRYTSEIEAKANATRRQVEQLRKNNPVGAFGGALEDNIRDIERASLSEQADLAILQNSALRNFDTAKSIADRQLELKLEPLKTNLDNLKFFYGENKDILSKADDRAYNELIKTKDREYKKIEDTETQLNEIKKNVAQYAGSDAASLIQKLSKIDSKSPDAISKALSIAGKYQSDPLEKAIKRAQLDKLNQDISQSRVAFNLKSQGNVTGLDAKQQQIETRRLDVQDKINEIKRLKNHSGLGVVVGPNALFSRGGSIKSMTGETADFVGSVKQLTDQATLDTLLALKAAGGTLGAIAVKELEILQNSATKINNWEKKDKNGNGTGVWSIDEKSFKTELSRLETSYQRVIDALPGNATDSYFEASNQALIESNSPFLQP
jgi:hypothetical protein